MDEEKDIYDSGFGKEGGVGGVGVMVKEELCEKVV